MISLSVIDMIALMAVVFIGLPHGAFDGAVYTQLPHPKSRTAMMWFFTIYSAMALLVIGIWLALPLLSLILFLAISAFHFGKGDSAHITGRMRIAAIIAHGGLVTIYLPLIHQAQAFSFFALLTYRDVSELTLLGTLLNGAAIIWLCALILYGAWCLKHRTYWRHLIEVVVAAIIMAYLPILAAFAFYFCLIHSARHFHSLYHAVRDKDPKSVLPLGFGLSCASWAMGLAAGLLLVPYQAFAVSIFQIIFIGLAALTVPHMILVDGFWRPLATKG